jgi:hypothetical protein
MVNLREEFKDEMNKQEAELKYEIEKLKNENSEIIEQRNKEMDKNLKIEEEVDRR